MKHTATLTLSRGTVKAQCSCGEQSRKVSHPDGMIALRVWKHAHRHLRNGVRHV